MLAARITLRHFSVDPEVSHVALSEWRYPSKSGDPDSHHFHLHLLLANNSGRAGDEVIATAGPCRLPQLHEQDRVHEEIEWHEHARNKRPRQHLHRR
jgi:hypothetical protein